MEFSPIDVVARATVALAQTPEDFAEAFAKAQRNPAKASRLTSLMAYAYGAGERKRVSLYMSREYTLQVLYRLGLAWPVTSWDYLRRFMRVLNGLGYFDEEK